jgi:hypothetical protein
MSCLAAAALFLQAERMHPRDASTVRDGGGRGSRICARAAAVYPKDMHVCQVRIIHGTYCLWNLRVRDSLLCTVKPCYQMFIRQIPV